MLKFCKARNVRAAWQNFVQVDKACNFQIFWPFALSCTKPDFCVEAHLLYVMAFSFYVWWFAENVKHVIHSVSLFLPALLFSPAGVSEHCTGFAAAYLEEFRSLPIGTCSFVTHIRLGPPCSKVRLLRRQMTSWRRTR